VKLSKFGNIRQHASHLGGSMRAFIAAIQATRKRMRSHLLTGALLALVTIVPTITPLTAQPADNSAYGRRLYHDKAQCSFCHGWAADGSGEPQSNGGAANLRQSFLNRDQLVEVISCGRPGTPMPHL
jgi:mono/diheme cytochrome c family protein